jgi:AcrR family transcriptional regulator
MPETSKKFERHLPEARRKALIEATLRCLAREGHEGLSIRHICTEAGVSVGLINHHFPNKAALIAETYRHLHAELSVVFRAALDAAGPSARAKLDAYFRASFSKPNLDPGVLNVWIVFWSLARHMPEIAGAHEETYGATVELLASLLGALLREEGLPALDTRLAAIGLNSLLDGLWLEWCLNPRTFSPEQAIRLCEGFVEGLRTGAYAGVAASA